MSHKNLMSNGFGRMNGDNIKTTSSVIFYQQQPQKVMSTYMMKTNKDL